MIPSVAVTALINDQSGNPLPGVTIIAKLSGSDEYQGFVAPVEQSFVTDSAGAVSMPLWSNTLGVNSTHYIFSAKDTNNRLIFSGTGIVPVSGPVTLVSFMVLT